MVIVEVRRPDLSKYAGRYVAEVFDCDCLRMSVELFLPAQHEADQAVWRQAVDGAEGTWRKRCEAWRPGSQST